MRDFRKQLDRFHLTPAQRADLRRLAKSSKSTDKANEAKADKITKALAWLSEIRAARKAGYNKIIAKNTATKEEIVLKLNDATSTKKEKT